MTQLRDGEVAPGPQSYVWLCRKACDLQVEQGTASWWGMGLLWGLTQVQIEFIFLLQPASSSQSPPPLKEERQVAVDLIIWARKLQLSPSQG